MLSKEDVKREIKNAVSEVNREAVNNISDDDATGVLPKEKLLEYRRNIRESKKEIE